MSFLYVPAYRFSRVWSALAMIGVRTGLGGDAAHDTEALLNVTGFADVGPTTTVGVETNLASDLDEETLFLLMPQIHQEVTDHFMIQAGAGVEFSRGHTDGQIAARVVYNF